jgi:PAS domain S-box-containing protein
MTPSVYPPTEPSAVRKLALLETPTEEHPDALRSTERESKQARDYAEAIIKTVPPLLVLDANLRVKTANESFYKHFRVSPTQTENCLVYELGNGQWNIPKLRTFLEEILPRHSFFKDFEVTHQFETIGRRTVLLSGHQVDHLERILLFIDDITERVESRVALRASEIRYRRLFEAARDGILILNPNTRKITDANPFMTELLGYPHDELLGKELWEIGLLKDEEASRAAFRQLQQKTFIRYEDLPLQNKKGQRREVEFVSNLYQENGHEVIQCNIRDITDRKRTENTLRQAKDRLDNQAVELELLVAERTAQLQETVGELRAFSYSVSHDLRAPLRAMQGFAQYLLAESGSKLDEQGIHYLQQIMRSATRLDHLIQDVLSYSEILHAQVPMWPVDLDRLVRDVIETYPNGQAPQAGIQIRGTLPKVLGNEALLTQCVSNLLSNATKFVSPGITPRVEIWGEEPEDAVSERESRERVASADGSTLQGSEAPYASTVRIWFEDNGIGIARENHERIFRMFERIHPSCEYEGTGIGLTIVRKAVERMGAQVGFESELGKGSKFWIQLQKG